MYLSVIIPAYNEAQRIGDTLQNVVRYLHSQSYDSEVIVVDDGSRDQTAEIARMFCDQTAVPEVRVVSYHRNGGKGFAVRTGMEAAKGAFRLYYDADASTPISEVEKAWVEFDQGADVVIGSRALPASELHERQALYRETMGRIFNLLLRGLGMTQFRDTQCGFKIFTKRAVNLIFPRQRVNRYSFDAEILMLAERAGLKVCEIPIQWRNSPHSSVNPITDALRMFYDILRIRINVSLGRYKAR
jgi:dolichyl-phosphate beta-glucosyltransferase